MRFIYSKLLLLLCIPLILISGCKENDAKPPLSVKKMSTLLIDLQSAEIYSVGRFPGSDTMLDKSVKNLDTLAHAYAMIFKHHKISPSQFEEYLEWYQQHPVYLDSMYIRVAADITKYKTIDKLKVDNLDSIAPSGDSITKISAPSNNGVRKPATPLHPDRNVSPVDDNYEQNDIQTIKDKSKQIKESLEKVKKQI